MLMLSMKSRILNLLMLRFSPLMFYAKSRFHMSSIFRPNRFCITIGIYWHIMVRDSFHVLGDESSLFTSRISLGSLWFPRDNQSVGQSFLVFKFFLIELTYEFSIFRRFIQFLVLNMLCMLALCSWYWWKQLSIPGLNF